jgi:hypothetical protein
MEIHMKDKTRIKPLKIYVNDAEELAIRRACTSLGRTVSNLGRQLLMQVSTPAHRRPRHRGGEGTKQGPVANRFPAQRVGAVRPMRL